MQSVILWGMGMAGGMGVAAGVFTFLALTGIPHRLMTMTHTSFFGGWYEWMYVLGTAIGNAVWLTNTRIKMVMAEMLVGATGFFIGIFIGCLIGAMAEVLDAFPVFFRRTGIRQGIGMVIVWMAIGKALGAWLWYFILL